MVLKIMLIAAVLHSAAEARPPARRLEKIVVDIGPQANIGMKEVLKSPPSDGDHVFVRHQRNNPTHPVEDNGIQGVRHESNKWTRDSQLGGKTTLEWNADKLSVPADEFPAGLLAHASQAKVSMTIEVIPDKNNLPSAFKPSIGAPTSDQCGVNWLSKYRSLDLRPKLNSKNEVLFEPDETVVGGFKISLTNVGTGHCDPAEVDIWAALYGPENVASLARPSDKGDCSWSVPFRVTATGKYLLEMKVLALRGDAPFDYAKCRNSEGFMWTGGELLASIVPGRLYVPEEGCCELCTRDPRCTHYSFPTLNSGKRETLAYNGSQSKCLLFSGANGKTSNGAATSGFSRAETTTAYLGSSLSWIADAGIGPFCRDLDTDHLAFSKVWINVSIANGNIAHFVDQAAKEGAKLHNREQEQLCDMKSAKRVPPEGRWLDVKDSIVQHEMPLQGMPGSFCGSYPIGLGGDPPVSYIGSVRGPFPPSLNHAPSYYWQPYSCNNHYFHREELRECLQARGRRTFYFVGDSVMSPWTGTGLGHTFVELLTGWNHSISIDENKLALNDSFQYLGTNSFEKTIAPKADVLVINFVIMHKLWHFPVSEIQRLILKDVQDIKDVPWKSKPLLYYMAPPAPISERDPHVTMPRAAIITKWLREVLVPAGFVELDLFSLTMARSFDSACGNDGMHPNHNVRLTMSHALANHACRG